MSSSYNNCKHLISLYGITRDNYRKVVLNLKKRILSEGIIDFEHDTRYVELVQAKDFINSYLNNNGLLFNGFHTNLFRDFFNEEGLEKENKKNMKQKNKPN